MVQSHLYSYIQCKTDISSLFQLNSGYQTALVLPKRLIQLKAKDDVQRKIHCNNISFSYDTEELPEKKNNDTKDIQSCFRFNANVS